MLKTYRINYVGLCLDNPHRLHRMDDLQCTELMIYRRCIELYRNVCSQQSPKGFECLLLGYVHDGLTTLLHITREDARFFF